MAASNHTNVQAQSKEGHQVNLQHTSTDSPILPAENLRQLQQIDPALVPWVINQTELESNHRRSEESKINLFILIEHLAGVVAGLIVAIVGLCISAFLIMNNHDWAGVTMGGVGLATIVSILVARQRNAQEKNSAKVIVERRKSPAKK